MAKRELERDIRQTKRKLFFDKEHDSPMAEAFRGLRTNLHFMNEDKESQVIVFTSSVPKEGKTTVASNYAVSCAVNNKKTIIIDCDIRRPRVDNAFDMPSGKGLLSYLREEIELDKAIRKTKIENLDIMTTSEGRNFVTEMFHSKRFKELVKELRKSYDIVVLDTPPAGVGNEAGIVSAEADGVVVVCGYNMINKKQLLHTKKHLEQANANIFGVVVNRIDRSGYSYGSYSYYTDYYRYYNEYND